MWTKQECREFFKKLFGLELSEPDLDSIWSYLNTHHITPISRFGEPNVGFTPLMLRDLVNLSLERTGLTLQDPRYKKISEEIMPAYTFAMLLKYLSGNEYLIVSSDVPDIALMDFDRSNPRMKGPKASAIPIEAVFLTQRDFEISVGTTPATKVAEIIAEKKFLKRYIPQTVLLVTLNIETVGLDLAELSKIIMGNKLNKFHQIWVFIGMGSEKCVMARIFPSLEVHEISVYEDLFPLLY